MRIKTRNEDLSARQNSSGGKGLGSAFDDLATLFDGLTNTLTGVCNLSRSLRIYASPSFEEPRSQRIFVYGSCGACGAYLHVPRALMRPMRQLERAPLLRSPFLRI